jgi:transcriptional regulator with XRE-family HTH domain
MARHDDLVALGARIRELRTKRGWSQEGFADRCGLDRTYIGGIERGERNVAVLNLLRIARTLDVGVGALFLSPGTDDL